MNQERAIALAKIALQSRPKDPWLTSIYDEWYEPYYHFMYLLAKEISPMACIELGVHNGRGSASLCKGTTGPVIGIDIDDHVNLPNIRAKCSNFHFHHSTTLSQQLALDVRTVYDNVGLLHIDTEHNYNQVISEFSLYSPALQSGAIILFDDTHAANDAVIRAARDLPLAWLEECDDLHPVCGFAFGGMW